MRQLKPFGSQVEKMIPTKVKNSIYYFCYSLLLKFGQLAAFPGGLIRDES